MKYVLKFKEEVITDTINGLPKVLPNKKRAESTIDSYPVENEKKYFKIVPLKDFLKTTNKFELLNETRLVHKVVE